MDEVSNGREEDPLHCVTEHCLDYWRSTAETHAETPLPPPVEKRSEIRIEIGVTRLIQHFKRRGYFLFS